MSVEMVKLSSPEKVRYYTFPNGESVTLYNVVEFGARPSGSHRLKTKDGNLHIVPTGWIHIEIIADDWSL
jgi:hypothetical protein